MDHLLNARFREALLFASQLHASQYRKLAKEEKAGNAKKIPYVGHLLAVAALVIDDGGTEDEAIAALLHDAAEDQGGEATLLRIEALFGNEVAAIVSACSDTMEEPKPEWEVRKRRYLEHLSDAPQKVLRVSCADKVHNAQSIIHDHRRVGDVVWNRFHRPKDRVIWYYDELAKIFRLKLQESILPYELERLVAEMKRL
ncbi:HD domain-containing protein [Heliophilum fasciatum]|uniref:HD domain-containing protein n=1 Tax=Heliophilum fasciatum TaxID=35700 RepID=A0A4R2RLF3_9FIRM|nr:HD domain-containing protein [Heliophilum fasciatum]MCW2278226.1 (p)ppGpp synthase/HD superfamily hydrolase [Heliophilum fasciatum]TCP63953.1 HD domain-containing protein [Heliophilum fasciatum]